MDARQIFEKLVADNLVLHEGSGETKRILSEAERLELLGIWARDMFLKQAQKARKSWASSYAFLEEFTLPEQTALANNLALAGLALQIAAWRGEVWADDPRLVAGLDALEAYGIISSEKRAAIAANPSL
jgi:hypothetical protein